jgi:hypothetical protein
MIESPQRNFWNTVYRFEVFHFYFEAIVNFYRVKSPSMFMHEMRFSSTPLKRIFAEIFARFFVSKLGRRVSAKFVPLEQGANLRFALAPLPLSG